MSGVEIHSPSSKNAFNTYILSKFMFYVCGASERQDNDPTGTIMDTEGP